MHNRIKEAFDQIHAEEDLKNKTKLFIARKMHKDTHSMPVRYKRMLMAAACLLFLFIGFGGYRAYFTPTAAISIDINPSIELGVNRFDQVISVDGYNDDGQELADQLDLKFMNYAEAVDQILNSERIVELLAQDEELTIAVIGPDGTQCAQMLTNLEACTAGQKNANCYHADWTEVEQAHALGLSYGKYKAFLEAQAVDPEITVEDIQNMTMKEIHDLIKGSSGDNSETQTENGAGNGNNNQGNGKDDSPGHGSGSGQGNGQGAGQGSGQGNAQGNGQGSGQGNRKED